MRKPEQPRESFEIVSNLNPSITMASLNWVGPHTRSPFLKSVSHIPYIMSDTDEYIDGFNFYLQSRCSGQVQLSKGMKKNVGTYHRAPNTIRAIGYNLTNFSSWLECPKCHPDEGAIHWTDVASWHIDDLYREHMVLGFWTQEYWATANEFSLNFPTTIRGRLREAHACCQWMANEGLIEWPKYVPPLQKRQEALRRSIDLLTKSMPDSLRTMQPEPKYKIRQNPGDWSPLTPEQLRVVLRHIDRPVGYLTFLLYLWTGMRLQELIDNTLVPGALHVRSPREQRFASPNFPKKPYQLKYDTSDLTMVGVLPDENITFGSNGLMLPLRILGKGTKIRTIHVPRSLMRDLWRYYVTKRPKVTSECSSAMFVNKRCNRLTSRNVAYAIASARKNAEKELGQPILLTPHVLRHTFACLSLEAVINGRAKEDGGDPTRLTQDQIERYGAEGVVVVQEWLGHALAKDTAKYLRQLSLSSAGLKYLEFFSTAMKETLGDGASF